MQCIPKSVTIRRTNSYHELPITIGNQSKFMAPITKIDQEYAEELDRNNLIPPLYFIDEQWIGLIPMPTRMIPPKEVLVEFEELMTSSPPRPIGSEVLYTQEEIKEVRRTLDAERRAVENIITRKTAGLQASGQEYAMINIFNEEEIKHF
ncbi:unnamed protein product [Phaedon cochleariae]|uniref:Uncharacterized protein n=1 Tax=Phaedon cochleariae TaxID=80249 RepID=A0A9N9X4Y0_PHACE|nr:unnamed protein product [Phaedon cochleariae]